MHDDKVVEIEKVEGGETENRGYRGFQESLPQHQFFVSVLDSQSQIHSAYYRAENDRGFGEKQ